MLTHAQLSIPELQRVPGHGTQGSADWDAPGLTLTRLDVAMCTTAPHGYVCVNDHSQQKVTCFRTDWDMWDIPPKVG